MTEPLACPHCRALLTDGEVVRLHRQYANAQRKVRAGGHNGGRPVASGSLVSATMPHDHETARQILDRARRQCNAVLGVGPASERVLIPIEEET